VVVSPEEKMQRLTVRFFAKPTVEVACSLLGKILVHASAAGIAAGRIVETEAYLFHQDPACHAARGKTTRNAAMFGPPGTAYVYLVYGLYHCFNVVTGKAGEGEAVLIRSLEPLSGLELMASRRGTTDTRLLASGPGRLCQALAINLLQNGADLSAGPLYLAEDGYPKAEINTTGRIGIRVAADLPLRFYIAGNPFVSRK
jgi:DNA-3-methyladenine glycosylase